MNCIKCGRELRGEQVFCYECQEEMENYPIKPGTPVQLPVRTQPAEPKVKASPVRKTLPPEVRLRRLRTTIRLLILALVTVLLAFVLTAFLTLHLLDQRDQRDQQDQQSHIGQNYHVTSEE